MFQCGLPPSFSEIWLFTQQHRLETIAPGKLSIYIWHNHLETREIVSLVQPTTSMEPILVIIFLDFKEVNRELLYIPMLRSSNCRQGIAFYVMSIRTAQSVTCLIIETVYQQFRSMQSFVYS